jgi:hypothetical protein
MRILFFLPLTSHVRHFDSVILALADRGHEIGIATPGRATNWPLPEALASHPNVTEVTCPEGRTDGQTSAARLVRASADYERYRKPPFLEAGKLRQRARGRFKLALKACEGAAGPAARQLLDFREADIPSDPGRERFLEAERPDIILVSPLIELGSDQADWVKSAKALGIPVGFPVFSWDNLTTKGLVHVQPDRVYVWNDIQKREAVEYHGAADRNVVVTGAPRFDAFIALGVRNERARFCERYGLRPERPIVTYLCSSEFVAGREVEFVREWASEIRQAPSLADCNILVRPHPRALRDWIGLDVTAWPQVAVARSKLLNADHLLYDTLYHSAAVVGLNTSAQLEAGILGKPVYTILAPQFVPGQRGTLHFRYLLRDEGGFVEVARDFEEHRQQVSDAIRGRFDHERIRTFVADFIRPAGWDTPATSILADAIEALGSTNAATIATHVSAP